MGKSVLLAAAALLAAGPAAAKDVGSVETIVFTAQKIDARKLTTEQRLQHVCKAATYLRGRLATRKPRDQFDDETVQWLVELSCLPVKPN